MARRKMKSFFPINKKHVWTERGRIWVLQVHDRRGGMLSLKIKVLASQRTRGRIRTTVILKIKLKRKNKKVWLALQYQRQKNKLLWVTKQHQLSHKGKKVLKRYRKIFNNKTLAILNGPFKTVTVSVNS